MCSPWWLRALRLESNGGNLLGDGSFFQFCCIAGVIFGIRLVLLLQQVF
jgi:hypothetical protein